MSSLVLGFISSGRFSSLDLSIIAISSLHLLFSFSSAAYVLHFHFHLLRHRHHHHHHHQHSSTSSSSSSSLRLLLRLNSLWPVRLLLLLFASLLSLSELLRLPFPLLPSFLFNLHRRPHWLCTLYSLSSQSFSQPAFFSTLLFLLRASTSTSTSTSSSSSSSSSSFLSALSFSIASSLPFLLLHSLFLFLPPSLLPDLLLPPSLPDRCPQPLFSTMLLALLAALYVPLFLSACSSAVTVVINKRLRVRLYALAAAVLLSLSAQVVSLALSSLWAPGSALAQGLGVSAFVAVMGCAVVGEGILVVMPVVDALAIVEPERSSSSCGGGGGGDGGSGMMVMRGKDCGGELRV